MSSSVAFKPPVRQITVRMGGERRTKKIPILDFQTGEKKKKAFLICRKKIMCSNIKRQILSCIGVKQLQGLLQHELTAVLTGKWVQGIGKWQLDGEKQTWSFRWIKCELSGGRGFWESCVSACCIQAGLKGHLGCLFICPGDRLPCWVQDGVPRERLWHPHRAGTER